MQKLPRAWAYQDYVSLKSAVIAGQVVVWHRVVICHRSEDGPRIVAGCIYILLPNSRQRAAGKGIWRATRPPSHEHGCQDCVCHDGAVHVRQPSRWDIQLHTQCICIHYLWRLCYCWHESKMNLVTEHQPFWSRLALQKTPL